MTLNLNNQLNQYIKKSWFLAWPIMLANLATPLLAMTDAFILGHLPKPAFLAALSIGTGIFAYILWGFNCISLSCSTFTANANSTKNNNLINNRLYQYSFIALVTSLILFLILQFGLDSFLKLINTPQSLINYVGIYLKILSYSIPALLFTQVAIAWFTGIKKPKIALYVLLISSSINIILDLVFVFIFKMDIDGVALASVIAQYITAFFVLIFIYQNQNKHLKQMYINRQSWLSQKQVFSFGGTLLIRSGILLSVFLIFNLKSASISESTAAANVLLMTLLILISSVLDSTASSTQVQLASSTNNQRRILQSTFILMSVFVIGFISLILIFGKLYLNMISNQKEIVDIAITYLPWMLLLCITSSTSYWLDGVFLGWQKSNWMRNSVIFSACLAYFPWIFTLELSNHQLWFLLNAFMTFRSVFMWLYFYKKKS